MQSSYTKAVIAGLIVAGVSVGLAATIALTLFVTIAVTQNGFLVSVVPVIFIAVFLVITLALLQKDAVAMKKAESKDS
ncbi:MAG: hypothetical protein IAE97_05180 [Chthoniobacterales bacterium]|nr:hypothetical protein [Chthoniobacterales bacterium]